MPIQWRVNAGASSVSLHVTVSLQVLLVYSAGIGPSAGGAGQLPCVDSNKPTQERVSAEFLRVLCSVICGVTELVNFGIQG